MKNIRRENLTESDISRIQDLVNELGVLLPFNTIRDKQKPLDLNGMVGLIMLLFGNLSEEDRVNTANLMFEHYGDASMLGK